MMSEVPDEEWGPVHDYTGVDGLGEESLKNFRLIKGEPVSVLYRALYDCDQISGLLRIVWNGDAHRWMSGDGFFARPRTGWRWVPEDFSVIRGMAWKVSGLGGADDDSEPISREDALSFLASQAVEPDSLDRGEYPSLAEQAEFVRRRELLF